MNKLPRNRLDDTLNAILVAVAAVALLTLTVDGVRNDQAAATLQASAQAAPVTVASLQAPVAKGGMQLAAR